MDDCSDDTAYGLVPGSHVGAYLLEKQIGQGGMAVVFRAFDERLERRVALKIMKPEYAADKQLRARFVREPKAASAVDHPHIIPVYEADTADGVLYIAMRYVEGGDVSALLGRGALTIDQVAGIISPVASALDAVHRIGLVHRDVKPQNMLLDVGHDRPDHVYLSDWGISKGAFFSWPGTAPGMFLGTVAYVAPEQAKGQPLDGRADQYALGCAAFEMICGEPPFPRRSQSESLDAHMKEMAPTVTSRRPALPASLDEVFGRVLSKRPEERYSSCGEFSAALREASGLPPYYLRTVPGPLPPRPRPRLPRRAIVVAAAAAATAGLVAFIVLSLGPGHGPVPHPSSSASTPPLLSPPSHGALALGRRGFIPESVTFSPDGKVIAVATTVSGGGNGKTFLWNLVTGKRTPLQDPKSQGVRAVAFSPDGAVLAVGDANGRTYLWNVAARKITATLQDHADQDRNGVNAVAFSPDGAVLAAGDDDGRIYLWNPATGKKTAALRDPVDQDVNAVNAVAFSPDGAVLAVGDNDGSTYLWNTATRTVTATLTEPAVSDIVVTGPDVQTVAFSPDGDTLATGDSDGRAYLWNANTGARIATLADPGEEGVEAVAFSPGGDHLAVGDADGSTYLWNPVNRAITATLHVPQETHGVSSVAFSPKSAILATGNHAGSTFLWSLTL